MESISRISSLLETARDLTLEAARDAGAVRRAATTGRPLPPAQIKKLLDSRNERDALEGMRRVVAMHYAHHPTSVHLTSAINNLTHPSPSLRRLVSILLLSHAATQPDTALLSINALQKTLSDPSPAARALALRTMSAIPVPAVSAIVALAVKKGAADLYAIVRRAAAFAAVKCARLDAGMRGQMEEVVGGLLGDREYFVVGAAVASWRDLCPGRIDMLHKHYRGLVKKLVDMDEWGQLATLEALMVYARRCFPRRTRRVKRSSVGVSITPAASSGSKFGAADPLKGFYDDDNVNAADTPADQSLDIETTEEVYILDPDLELLLRSIAPLLHSRNSGVVLAVTKTYLYLSPPDDSTTYLSTAIGPVIALLRSPADIQQLALRNIEHLALTHAPLLAPYVSHFLVRASDDLMNVAPLKLSILSLLFPAASARTRAVILTDLAHVASSASASLSDDDNHHNAASFNPNFQSALPLARSAIRAISRCALHANADTTAQCLAILHTHLSSSSSTTLVTDALDGIRQIIARDPPAHARTTVIRLAASLDATTLAARARASIIWLVGEFATVAPAEDNVAADVLRLLVRNFADEAVEVRAQILLLAAKVYVQHLNAEQELAKTKTASAIQKKTKDKNNSGDDDDDDEPSDPAAVVQPARPEAEDEPEKEHQIPLLWRAVLHLVRYDTSYDLRDRARVLRALLASPASTELASLLLQAPKPAPLPASTAERRRDCELGGARLILGDDGMGAVAAKGGEALPEWVREGEEPDARLRDVGGGGGSGGGGGEAAADARGGGRVVGAGTGTGTAGDVSTAAAATGGSVFGKKKMGEAKTVTLDQWLESESEGGDTESESESESGDEEDYEEEEESEYETDDEDDDDDDDDDEHKSEHDRLVT